MANRKSTVRIKALIENVNYKDKTSTCSAEVRQGWNALLEDVLHNANVYAGYNCYGEMEVPVGEKPGIVWTLDGTIETRLTRYQQGAVSLDGLHIERSWYEDDTRRFYYVHRSLAVLQSPTSPKGY